jgi:hypothetical protein
MIGRLTAADLPYRVSTQHCVVIAATAVGAPADVAQYDFLAAAMTAIRTSVEVEVWLPLALGFIFFSAERFGLRAGEWLDRDLAREVARTQAFSPAGPTAD